MLAVVLLIIAAGVFVRYGTRPSVFETVVSALSDYTGGIAGNTLLPFGDKETLKKETQQEKENAARLLLENTYLQGELRRLKFMKESGGVPGGIAARVVARDPATWARSVVVNRGTDAGVQPGFIATNHRGLAGRVTECSSYYCTVRLITAPDEATSCMISAPGSAGAAPKAFCMAFGNSSLELDAMVVSSKLGAAPGDIVYTSGYGENYPRGLPLGVIAGPAESKSYSALGYKIDTYVSFWDVDYLMLSKP